jgi:hypothetical protein
MPQEFLNSLSVQRRADTYTFDAPESDNHLTWIALDHDAIVGFVTVGHVGEDDAQVGELQALYVTPERWQLLAGWGHATARLWVLEENTRGRRFYEARGWSANGHQQVISAGGQPVTEVRYRKILV